MKLISNDQRSGAVHRPLIVRNQSEERRPRAFKAHYRYINIFDYESPRHKLSDPNVIHPDLEKVARHRLRAEWRYTDLTRRALNLG